MTSDKELGNLSGSYALNGLDAADLAEFEAHLQQSHATRDEVTLSEVRPAYFDAPG